MSEEQKTAFVTGATGAVGTALVRRLVGEGWRVTALHRRSSDTTTLRELGVGLVEGDVADTDLRGKVPVGTRVVFHTAADMNLWRRHNARQEAVNVGGTRNIVEAALQAGVQRFIHTSTVSAYGRHNEPISEDTPSNAGQSWISYERTKWLGEQEVRRGLDRGMEVVIINPSAVMGPGFTAGWTMLLRQLKAGQMKALPPGWVVVNHIADVVDAHVAAVTKARSGHNYILTGDNLPFAELIAHAAQVMGIELKAKVMSAGLMMAVARIGDFFSNFTGREPALTPEMAALMSQKLVLHTDKAKRELGYRETPWRVCVEEMYRWLHDRGGI
jgi:dihydroflavonol-4-reductase